MEIAPRWGSTESIAKLSAQRPDGGGGATEVSGFDSELVRRLSLESDTASSTPAVADAAPTTTTQTTTTTSDPSTPDSGTAAASGYLSPFQVQQAGSAPIGPVSDPNMTWEQYYQQYIQLGLSPQQAYGIDDMAPGIITPAQMQALGFKQEAPSGGGGIFWVGPGAQGDAAAWTPAGD